ncbi:MAG: acetylxylan esterase [Armatimonadetes bacterium]|nr:acetylxylan esterase [Armatimonadota bacterium]
MPDDPRIPAEDIQRLRRRLYEQFDAYYSRLCEETERTRQHRWQRDFSSLEAYELSVEPNRRRFLQMMGGWHWEREDLRPRVEHLLDTDAYRLDRVFLTCFEDIEIDCLLLTPPGDGPRPAVIAQHGLSGTPEDVCGFTDYGTAYGRIGIRLAEAGYTVIAPHMVGGFGEGDAGRTFVAGLEGISWGRARTRLNRKAFQVGQRLFGAEMFCLSRVVDYLQTLPDVLPERIGFYGLSQGGQTALWFPALEKRVKASVGASFFNHRFRKQVVSGGDDYRAYLDTEEEDKFYPGQLLEFSDADIASLICPRAYMVEQGTDDAAVHWKLAQEEFSRLKPIYERLGIGDRAQIVVFEGRHEIRGVEGIAFLDRWLREEPI